MDESRVPIRGRVKFRQYIPGKPHRYGCKLFRICTPDGYTWNLMVCSGKSACESSMGLSDSVVVRLARDLLNKAQQFLCIIITRPILLQHFSFQENYMCFTARANCKHLSTSVTRKKLKQGGMASAVRKEVKVFN